jgi:hypothetical protein
VSSVRYVVFWSSARQFLWCGRILIFPLVVSQLTYFNGTTHFAFSKGATTFKIRLYFQLPQKNIGLAMEQNSFTAKLVVQYLRDYKCDLIIPTPSPNGVQFRPHIPAFVLVDESTPVGHLVDPSRVTIILIYRGLEYPKVDEKIYTHIVSVSNLSKLYELLKL